MKTLLYFEETECPLSTRLLKRKDINLVILRTTKNLSFFSEEYLKLTSNCNVFVADYYNDINEEVKKFKAWAMAKGINITNFLNDSEFYLEYANDFARLLNLPSLTEKQSCWVRDKVAMKKKFNEIGLSTVLYSPIESKEDIIRFFIENGSNRIVFKPRRGVNSYKTYILDSIEDIEALNINFKPNKYMVETFCYDHEWSIESIVQDGIVLDSYVTYIPYPTLWASINNKINCHMTVPVVPKYFDFVPKEFIQKIVTGMNLKNGAMTIEVFIDENGNVKPSELGWRLAGCQATSNHSLSYGIDLYEILIDIMLDKKVNLVYRDKILSVGDLYLPNKEGVITEITPLEELLKKEGVINGQMFANLGEYQVKKRLGNDASGWVQVMGIDELDTLKKMEKIFAEFKIEVAIETYERKRKYGKKDY